MSAGQVDAIRRTFGLYQEMDVTRGGGHARHHVAKDGTPRVVPIAFTWNGTKVVMCTSTNAPKLASLRRNPAVALTTGAGQAFRHAQPD